MSAKKPEFSVIIPPNTLKLKAARPGGMSRAEAADAAASVVARAAAEHRTLTIHDVEELDRLSAAVCPGDAAVAQRRRFFRKAHDLWSLGETFGYPLVTEVSGSLCTYLAQVEDGSPLDRAIVLLHIQSLHMVIGAGMRGPGGAVEREMVQGLHKAVAKSLSTPGN